MKSTFKDYEQKPPAFNYCTSFGVSPLATRPQRDGDRLQSRLPQRLIKVEYALFLFCVFLLCGLSPMGL